ncbi:MAG: hypothetical protein P8X90_00495 [Desulfobacterales bacterium]
MNATELSPEQLFQHCDPAQMPFDTTTDLTDLARFFGQPRAVEALRFGIGVRRQPIRFAACRRSG